MIRAVFFDIDGTLVSMDTHRMREDTKEALHTLKKKGIRIFISTGRHMQDIRTAKGDLLEGVPFDGYVLINGQYCIAGEKQQVIHKHPIPAADIKSLVELLRTTPFPCVFLERQDIYINFVNERVIKEQERVDLDIPPIEDISRALCADIYQVVPYVSMEEEKLIMSSMPHCSISRWSDTVADIIPADGCKRVGVEKMLKHFQISPSECMAVGDGENDVDMLKYAGIGVAMGNAQSSVKAAANYITDDIEKGGLCEALRHFGLL